MNSLSEEEWFSTYGQVAGEMISQGVMSYMTGHIALPWIEDGAGGAGSGPVPATVSERITTGLLRERLGFDGVVLSDALDMGGFLSWGDYTQRIIDCFNCGTDVLLWPGVRYFAVMEQAVEDGRVSRERLKASVRRILELKARLGVHAACDGREDARAQPLLDDKLPPGLDRQVRQFSRELAGRCITLVRSRTGQLPLNPQEVRRVLVIMMNKVTEGRRYERMNLLWSSLRPGG